MAVVLVGPGGQVSTQVNPDKAKPEPRAFRYCDQRSWCCQTPAGRKGLGLGLGQHEDGVEKELGLKLKMNRKLRFTLGLGWWMPGSRACPGSRCEFLRVFGSSRAGKPGDKDLVAIGPVLH